MVSDVETSQTFTFVCRRLGGTSSYVDVQVMAAQDTRAHALRLLADHHSANVVEIWCEPTLVDQVERRPATSADASAD